MNETDKMNNNETQDKVNIFKGVIEVLLKLGCIRYQEGVIGYNAL